MRTKLHCYPFPISLEVYTHVGDIGAREEDLGLGSINIGQDNVTMLVDPGVNTVLAYESEIIPRIYGCECFQPSNVQVEDGHVNLSAYHRASMQGTGTAV